MKFKISNRDTIIICLICKRGLAMGEQNSVLILGGNPDIGNNLKSELESLGFITSLGRYPHAGTFDTEHEPPDIALLDFTADSRDTLPVRLSMFNDDAFLRRTAVVALVSHDTIEKLPLGNPIKEKTRHSLQGKMHISSCSLIINASQTRIQPISVSQDVFLLAFGTLTVGVFNHTQIEAGDFIYSQFN